MPFSISDLEKFVKANSPDIQAEVRKEPDGTAFLTFTDIQSEFLVAVDESAVQIRGNLVDKISEVPLHTIGNLSSLLLSLNDRFLGCKFAYNTNDQLAIIADVYADVATGEHVFEICEQMQYVSNSLFDLITRTIEDGVLPSDEEIDEALEQGG